MAVGLAAAAAPHALGMLKHLPMIGGIAKGLGGLFGGKSDEQKLAEQRLGFDREKFDYTKLLDRSGMQERVDELGHTRTNANATNPSRRFLLSKLMSILGGGDLPGMEDMLKGIGPSSGPQQNPLGGGIPSPGMRPPNPVAQAPQPQIPGRGGLGGYGMPGQPGQGGDEAILKLLDRRGQY